MGKSSGKTAQNGKVYNALELYKVGPKVFAHHTSRKNSIPLLFGPKLFPWEIVNKFLNGFQISVKFCNLDTRLKIDKMIFSVI